MDDPARQVALVSGGSRGLGYAVVRDFLSRGYRVATFSRGRSESLDSIERELAGDERFLWRQIDATDLDACREFALSVARRFGTIDVLINNAGIGIDGLLTMMRADDVRCVLDVNLGALINLTQACARVMLACRRGVIVNISSVAAIRGVTGTSVYSATKAAIDGFTRSLARELGPEGIRVNAVAPGYFESDMVAGLTDSQRSAILRRTPIQRLVTTDDLIAAIRFLVSSEAAAITGQTLVVDGGFTC